MILFDQCRYNVLTDYTPKASLAPSTLDLTDCPYMWPYCDQPLYAHAIPIIANITILNGIDVSGIQDLFVGWSASFTPLIGKVESVEWEPGTNGNYLVPTFTYSDTIWPWTGYLAIHITVSPVAALFDGIAEGVVVVNISSRSQYVFFAIVISVLKTYAYITEF